MKTLVTTLALAAFVATSGLAAAASRPSDAVVLNGKVIGQDPDVNIRAAIVKDAYPTGD
jgi:hypothetical protein